jgi:O-methyltransferase
VLDIGLVDTPAALGEARSLYLDLMKRCLLDQIYQHRELVPVRPGGGPKKAVIDRLASRGLLVVRERLFDPARRADAKGWPYHAHTMVGTRRLENIELCVSEVLRGDVEGDLIETGVWRGGAAIFMRAVLAAYGVTDRTVWVADSFRGLPAPDAERYPADEGATLHLYPELAVSLEEVRENFDRYGLLDDQVRFLEGWFRDTLPHAPIERLALMRLDGDLYESTMDALVSLYPRLSPGGFVIVDDYLAIASCRQAVDDFRRDNEIDDEIVQVDWSCIHWRRGRPAS